MPATIPKRCDDRLIKPIADKVKSHVVDLLVADGWIALEARAVAQQAEYAIRETMTRILSGEMTVHP